MVPCDFCQGVSALATCSSQARECERSAGVDEEVEEPKAKRLCGDSLEAAGLDGDSPAAGKEAAAGSDAEETAGVKLRRGTGGAQASAEVAQSTNLKRARNVGCLQNFLFLMWFLWLTVARFRVGSAAGSFNGKQSSCARKGAQEHQVGAAFHAGEVRFA
jgi:hypothetical protein